MRTVTKLLAAVGLAFLVGTVVLGVWVGRRGFSAREHPSAVEEFLARNVRRLALPAEAKGLTNPSPLTPETLPAAREHWVHHCAGCHGLDGRGETVLGRNLYPKPPDLRRAATQGLADGELFTIISNGVRFTGMPAWGGEDSPEEIWQLVGFIRRLPALSAEELKQMEAQAAGSRPHTDTHKH